MTDIAVVEVDVAPQIATVDVVVPGPQGPGAPGVIDFVLDGQGSALTPGIKGDIGPFPFAITLTSVSLLADLVGSLVVDLWVDAYGNFPPTAADSITAAAKPALASARKYQDNALAGWTTLIPAGATARINVDSASGVTRVTMALTFAR